MTHVLRIDASARSTGSITRDLADQIIDRLSPDTVTTRDLAEPLPLLTEDWVGANGTPAESRTEAQARALALSDALVAELQAADTLVIGVPLYNFGIPAALKAWVDLIARAGVTFRYTEAGPQGLLNDKRAILVMASGGVEVGSPVDFATPYMRQVLGFIGINDIEVIAADQLVQNADDKLTAARSQIEALAA